MVTNKSIVKTNKKTHRNYWEDQEFKQKGRKLNKTKRGESDKYKW
ncbi:hypothetical protein [Pasteurella phage PHB01]|uniref:Uncharacterized protein n=2 Tax=Wuhanvirus TaxID=2731989 RepID=A0A218M4D7_9CAUD|nr:hypothetical protein HOR82_gp40 [Pasteurella phage vB_PmuP_PHB02]YP_009790792.1 hypothetical protein HOR83_gp06 [Pasteurella phage PHB01]UIS73861.1 hypothetical protein [Pasteurella phage vB_PmuP_PS07]UIS74021.1 hypothetical protein [Pasteurella phage vB_PmuP_PS30]ARV77604.1 hypothetical protein [Pasteurella phage vB_PmuP_PHB02]ASD51020.1 hypothetical protein [Pasteurella phage PHB01]